MDHAAKARIGFTFEDRRAIKPFVRAVVNVMFKTRIEIEVRHTGATVRVKF